MNSFMSFFIFIFAGMQRSRSRKIKRIILIVFAIYIACGFALYFLQDKLLFHPQPLPSHHVFSFDGPSKEINLEVNASKRISIVQFTVPDSACKGVVLYFHGNMKNIERYAPFAKTFTRNGYAVWMIDYPGFGKSTGKTTEDILYNDANELYRMARARFAPDSILIYGKSLGTGIAAHLASVRDCKRLVLETPYYSIDRLFRHYAFIYPVGLMTRYHLPVNEYLAQLDCPVAIFHGTDDELIPFSQAASLAAISNTCELIQIEGGQHHNLADYPLYRQKIDSLLQLK